MQGSISSDSGGFAWWVMVAGVGEAGRTAGQTQRSIQSDWDRQKHMEQPPQTCLPLFFIAEGMERGQLQTPMLLFNKRKQHAPRHSPRHTQ